MYDFTEQFEALRHKSNINVLGIESSCDETAAAVVCDGRNILSNVILSQVDIHKIFGGVVPEVASRNHTLALPSIADRAIKESGLTLEDIDAVAVTYGAGLVGALIVGVTAAKSLAYAWRKPLIKVNHLEGHIAANFLEHKELTPPFLSVVASGGHTGLIWVEDYCSYYQMGGTTDDAIGEAFDKVARLLGLGYPGGPAIDRLAKEGKPSISFYKTEKHANSEHSLSYSGLKTAVVNYVHNLRQRGEELPIADICASFTHAAVDILVETAIDCATEKGSDKIVLAGGVAANSYLRSKLEYQADKKGIKTLSPSLILCTDNAAMIASRAYYSIINGRDLAGLDLNAVSGLRIGE